MTSQNTEFQNRNTVQRKIILEELQKVCTHPEASEIYKMVKKRLPKIGLATVYRNLDYLEKQGSIIKLKSKNTKSRYDGNIENHCHLFCTKCNQVLDIFDLKKISLNSKQLKKTGFKPSNKFLEIPGLCKKCQKKS